MRYIFVLLLLIASSAHADLLDEQDLPTSEKDCKIHYLTPKNRNLWTISVDKNYCHDGWVHGFTTVTIKDALNRTVETLHGFFHHGYWLTDFIGKTDEIFRSNPEDGLQDLIYKTGADTDLNATYYTVARATLNDEKHYSAFTTCSKETTLLVAHDPISDFKQSLFQTALLKQAQEHLLKMCSQTKRIHIFGTAANAHTTQQAVFHADINLENEEIKISYHSPIDKSAIPMPSELRHEGGEHLLTIHPQKETVKATYGEEKKQPIPPPPPKSKLPKNTQSATDLALTAKVSNVSTQGRAIIFVDHMGTDQLANITRPTPLKMRVQTAMTQGWYVIDGTFNPENADIVIQPLTVKKCQKEWCTDED